MNPQKRLPGLKAVRSRYIFIRNVLRTGKRLYWRTCWEGVSCRTKRIQKSTKSSQGRSPSMTWKAATPGYMPLKPMGSIAPIRSRMAA